MINRRTRKKPDRASIEATSRVDEAKGSIGAILGFYRRIKKKSQKELGDSAQLPASSVAMFEAGKRLPSIDAIQKLSSALGLNSFQTRQLAALSEYPRRPSIAGHEWFLPDDVLSGIPLFLRDLKKEAQFQGAADIREMWLVTGKPLALAGEMYTMLSDRLSSQRTTFVYFIDSTAGEEPFQALWAKLLTERRHRPKDIGNRLKCVLTPGSFSLYHFAICNPGSEVDNVFGRSILYSGGMPIGFVGMDQQQVQRAYSLLSPIYQRCCLDPGSDISTAYGKFRLLPFVHKR